MSVSLASLPSNDAVKAELSRRHLLPFVARMYQGWQEGQHHRLIADRLEAVERGDVTRLMIFMPPRHTKSLLVSTHFPPWYLGRHPRAQLILASYGAALAYGFSRSARNIITQSDWPFSDVTLAVDSRSVQRWNTNKGGVFTAAGVRGPMTGKGADILIIDDPYRDRKDADSLVIREATWDWYTDVARTRLQPGGSIVICQTRWHQDDLCGRLLTKADVDGEQWEVLSLPARAEENDPLGRELGAPLWPEWYGEEALTAIRSGTSSRTWNALYQQRPTDEAGGIFKRDWFGQRYRVLPECRNMIQTVDGAWETGISNDYSVIATWATNGINYYIVDIWRARVEFPDLKRAIRDQAAKWRPNAILIEDTQSGKAAIQEMKRETNLTIIGVKPDGTKEARADAVSPIFESGRVYLPEEAAWVGDFIEEHVAFPTGTHDDQVDTTAYALHRLALGTPSALAFLEQTNAVARALPPKPERVPTPRSGMALPGRVR